MAWLVLVYFCINALVALWYYQDNGGDVHVGDILFCLFAGVFIL